MVLAPDLQEWVSPGHLAHHVSDVVDALDLTAFYAPYEGEEPKIKISVPPAHVVSQKSHRRQPDGDGKPAAAVEPAGCVGDQGCDHRHFANAD